VRVAGLTGAPDLMSTIQERVATARQTLRHAGIGADEARLSARVLAEHVLGWDATRYLTSSHESEPPQFAERYESLVARRAAREPSAHITGQQEFWGLSLEISPAVFIPRPETELIVEAALEHLSQYRGSGVAIADVCTGSGCLAVALASELPHASIDATDISLEALKVARRNARRHGVDGRIRFTHANMLAGVDGPFDMIVANPPYVRRADQPALQPEVRDYEPSIALFGGDSGVELVSAVVGQAVPRLRIGGHLIFEFGYGQDEPVEELIGQTRGLTMLGLRRDLQGIARTAVAQRTSS
jgi:release factor glutamine methyltransferase